MFRLRGISAAAWPWLAFGHGPDIERIRHVFLCVCDHWEPKWRRPTPTIERGRVERWEREYERAIVEFSDSRGRPPQHTFFYPAEEYEPEYIEALAKLCRTKGFGDVEIHLHHPEQGNTSIETKCALEKFRDILAGHGLLGRDRHGRVTYGFIHGNWALDNSRPDGRWCGVNDEITILRETGCYADFTMPSAPDPCQTSTINSIYYATDDPQSPKSHDCGTAARMGQSPHQDGLLMIQGPLALDWGRRKWGFLPRIENGDLTARNPPTLDRFFLWCSAGVQVQGREDWVFIKLYTHGAQEANASMLLGEPMRRFHQALGEWFNRHEHCKYYYVTAREMAYLVHQAEKGVTEPNVAHG